MIGSGSAKPRAYWQGLSTVATTVALVTAAEMALLYVFTAELSQTFHRAPMPWPGLWILGLIAFFLPRLLHGIPGRLYAVLLGAGILVVSILAIHAVAYADWPVLSLGWLVDLPKAIGGHGQLATRSVPLLTATLFVVWWRQMARETPGSELAEWLFKASPIPLSLLALLGVLLWGEQPDEIGQLVLYFAVYLIFALLALAFTRWAETPSRGTGRGTALATWISYSTAPLLMALAAGAGLGALAFGRLAQLLQLLGGIFSAVVTAIVYALGAIVFAILWVIFTIAKFVGGLFGMHAGKFRPPKPPPSPVHTQHQVVQPWHLPPWLIWALIILAGLIVLYLLTRFRPRRDHVAGGAVVRESVFDVPDVGAGLAALVGRLGRRMRREQDPLRAMLADPVWRYTAEVRLAYRDVQRLLQRRGAGRAPFETPSEYASEHPSETLHDLTAIYEHARYSTRPADRSEAERARALREAVRSQPPAQSAATDRAG